MSNKSFVVKIGGSLFPNLAAKNLQSIASSRGGHKITIVPGGGCLVDALRSYRSAGIFRERTMFDAALLSMLQHAILLRDIVESRICRNVEQLEDHFGSNNLAYYVPDFEFVAENRSDYDINYVTSDTVAASLAGQLDSMFVKITNVDGIYLEQSVKGRGTETLSAIHPDQLPLESCLDATSTRIIQKRSLRTWIVNGQHPERISQLLIDGTTFGTRIETS